MKYKLINSKTGEEHLCDKITIDGFDYYVNDFISDEVNGDLTKIPFEKLILIAVASNNPNIDIPKVIDDELAIHTKNHFKDYWKKDDGSEMKGDEISASMMTNMLCETSAFIAGYNKSQETHPFSEEDMIEFSEWCANSHYHYYFDGEKWSWGNSHKQHYCSTKELLQIWKEQKSKIIYYE